MIDKIIAEVLGDLALQHLDLLAVEFDDGAGAADAAPGALYDLAVAVGAKVALKDIGMPEDALDRAADLAVANPYYNPRPVTRDGVRALLDDAYFGRRPG